VRVVDICSPAVALAHPGQPLVEAARTLRDRRVGALVVVEENDPLRRPIGILTDRDIARRPLARSADLYCLLVRDVMTVQPLTLQPGGSLEHAVEVMSARGVRRAPVTNSDGSLVGIISLDDIYPAIARQFLSLGHLFGLAPKLRPGARGVSKP
jgi:CBS domain-containing protein